MSAGTDEFGIADALCVKKGRSYETAGPHPTGSRRRLTDFLEPDYETVETLYALQHEY